MDVPRRELFRRFKNFLKLTTDQSGARVYERRIRDMAGQNGESLLVSYSDICNFDSEMVLFLTDAPTETLDIFDAAAKEVVLQHFPGTAAPPTTPAAGAGPFSFGSHARAHPLPG